MIPVILGISIIAFITMYAAGDPISLIRAGKPNVTQATIDAMRVYYGLDKPIPIQYLSWLSNILQLNFGKSLYGGQPVNLIIGPKIWPTIELQVVSLLIAFAISIPIAVYSARKPYSKQDVAVTSFSLFGFQCLLSGWAYPNHSIFLHAWLATLRRITRGSWIFCGGETLYLIELHT